MAERSGLETLLSQLSRALPPMPSGLREDIENNIRATLQTVLADMELVTREEFDVQTAVLARTRAKLEALEAQVAELEKQSAQSPIE
ncbi:MAG: accessory factor UbiK family protein [Pseudomonadota bacterium]